MTTIETARALAGSSFDDLPDDVIVATLQEIERKLRRSLKSSEAAIFRSCLNGRRAFLAKQAGIVQPAFVPEMYGDMRTAQERAADTNANGEPQ